MLMSSIFLTAMIFSNGVRSAENPVQQNAKGTVCWPLHFAGVTLGITNDSQLRRLLGNGNYRRLEGETGGRYFIDEKRRATLHVVMYTDTVVGELSIQEGLDSKLKNDEQKEAVSKFFNPEEGFGNWDALHLGVTKAEVLKNLGEPALRISSNIWQYSTSCACEIPQFFTVYFKNERLFRVVFAAPAG